MWTTETVFNLRFLTVELQRNLNEILFKINIASLSGFKFSANHVQTIYIFFKFTTLEYIPANVNEISSNSVQLCEVFVVSLISFFILY